MVRTETSGFDTLFANASDDGRALVGSHLVATILALAWLALVHLVPRPLVPPSDSVDRVIVNVVPPTFEPAAPTSRAFTRRSGDGSRGSGSIASAFAGGAGVVDRGDLVRDVRVRPTGEPVGGLQARTVPLGTTAGSGTPGISRMGGSGLSGAGLGTVAGEDVPRATVAIRPPEVRPIAGGATSGDAREVGERARAHAPQLERCYQEEGLTRNPALAGLVRLVIDVEGGRVTSARIVDRSWTGAGVAETESCLLGVVRGWRLSTSTARVTLPFSFTSAAAR